MSDIKRNSVRPEPEIFRDLADLCSSPGYVHAIAYFSLRDNMIAYSGEMKPEDMHHLFSRSRLIRTELTTLIGLLIKHEIDYTLPHPTVMQAYVDRTEALLEEIHHSMTASWVADFDPEKAADESFQPFTTGAALREPIFYGGESAYSFQYRDFSRQKYARDRAWIEANKGFSIETARRVIEAVGELQNEKSVETVKSLKETPPDEWTYLPAYEFTAHEIATRIRSDLFTVETVLAAFELPASARNETFAALHDFNVINATPLIRRGTSYVLFHIYSLVEALYESPFYWMGADKDYAPTAMRNRGLFTEEFSTERLAHVFGPARVYPNVEIYRGSDRVGEIDVMALFGNRAVILQAKSKRLTLEARKGNDGQIRDDFKKSIQDSCDQAYSCAKLLQDSKYIFKDKDGRDLGIPRPLKDIYVLCVVADHYPALSFQARQFLKYEPLEKVAPPFVMDIFTLDAMTEMLESPLQLLSYIDRRSKYSDKLVSSHELTILSYHLKQNLWLDGTFDMVMLDDNVSTDLDLAMLARRENIPAARTPDGILTRFASTTLGRLVKQIETRPSPATIDLGFLLLTLGESTVVEVSKAVDKLSQQAIGDGKNHDVTISLGQADTGLTIHCNREPAEVAGPRLERHCALRKYSQKAKTWFGVCVDPESQSPRFGVNLDSEWQQNKAMDDAIAHLPAPGNLSSLLAGKRTKIGRNERCPCGSGKKFKKCCGANA
jgi:hypothetical protein